MADAGKEKSILISLSFSAALAGTGMGCSSAPLNGSEVDVEAE